MITQLLSQFKVAIRFNKIGIFTRNVLKLASGTALGQGLVVISTPIVTRLYTQEEMGLLGVFMAFVGVVAVGLSLRYEIAIVSAKNDREANHLLVAALFFTIPMSLLAGCAMWVMIRLNLLSYGELPLWSAFAVIVVLVFIGFFCALRYWHARHASFGEVSRSLVLQGCGRAVVPVCLAWGQPGWLGLLGGEVVGRSLGVLRLLRTALPDLKETVRHLDFIYLSSLLKEYWKYPLIVLPSSLIDALVVMLPLPVFAFLFGPTAAGQFLLVQRLSQLPSGLVSASVGDVFYAHLSEAYRKDNTKVRAILWMIIKKLGIVSTLIYLPVALASPFVFGLIFGEDWGSTGLLLSVLTPVSLVGMVVSPVSRVLFVINRTELKLILDCVRLVIPLTGLWVMYSLGYNFLYSVSVFSLLSTLNYALYLGLIWYVSGNERKSIQ